jgi:tetratricopeptide (TPR) repeat protein
MRIRYGRFGTLIFAAFACLFHRQTALGRQGAGDKPLLLVTSFGPGAIALPGRKEWKLDIFNVYDDGRRPVAQYSKGESGMTASFSLFENLSGKPSAQGCREDAIRPIIEHLSKSISGRVDADARNTAGEILATTSYRIDLGEAAGHHYQRNLFGFAGSAKTCAEIHISSVRDTPAEEDAMKVVLADFRPDLAYNPTTGDYFLLASLLFKSSPALAAPYYKSSLDTMPKDFSYLTPRRVVTDQLVMSLGMSGDLSGSRSLAEKAVAADPDYPMNYYNLACIDAEQGNAAQARSHLQQAFDRRANVLKGESMPDPTHDDSILKLKKDSAFWTFVQGLPKN